MPRVAKPLSEKEIKNAKAGINRDKEPITKAYTLVDGKGLQLLVALDGRKSWEFNYLSPKLHKRRITSFRTYPNVSLALSSEAQNWSVFSVKKLRIET